MILDWLRSYYVNLPASTRRLLSPLLSLVPFSVRYGGVYRKYRYYINRSYSDKEFIKIWQEQRLRSLLVKAFDKSSHYKSLFKNNGFDRCSLKNFSIADLEFIPILTKDEVRKQRNALTTCSTKYLDQVSTSGSSGTPLIFYLDKGRSPIEWAFIQDSWSRIGFSAKHLRAVFRGFQMKDVDKQPWEFEPALGELRFSPFHMVDKWLDKYCYLMKKYKIRFIHGYPSAISIFSKYILRVGREDIANQIIGIMLISEKLFIHQRELLNMAFPTAKITSFYGMSEKVLFATVDPSRTDTFVLQPLYGLCQLVDDHGRPILTTGTKGRLIGTSLLFKGMPFIRYETGDVGELVELPSKRNMYKMKVRNISSRWEQEFLVGSNNELISMTAINLHSEAYNDISSFQFHQKTPGEATVKIVPKDGATFNKVTPFANEISTKIGSSLKFKIELVDSLPKNLRGKTKFIDQLLSIKE